MRSLWKKGFKQGLLNFIQVQRQLAPDSRYFIGPDLDQNINAVMQNSMAVAHVSRDYYREAILGLSTEVGGAKSCDVI